MNTFQSLLLHTYYHHPFSPRNPTEWGRGSSHGKGKEGVNISGQPSHVPMLGCSCHFGLGLRMEIAEQNWARSLPARLSLSLKPNMPVTPTPNGQPPLKSVRTNAYFVCYWFCSFLFHSNWCLIRARSMVTPWRHILMLPTSGLGEKKTSLSLSVVQQLPPKHSALFCGQKLLHPVLDSL